MSSRVALGALGLACVMAAGGGAYLATRQNAGVAIARSAASASEPASSPAVKPASTVAETEAVIGEAGKEPAAPARAEAPDPLATIAPVHTPATPAKSASRTTRPASAPSPPTPASTPSARAQTTTGSTPVAAESTRSAPASAPEPETSRPADPPPTLEPALPPPPPARVFEELVVPADSVIGLEIENTLSSERARIEDRIEAHVTRDVKVGDRVAIPAGSKMLGSVTLVERGGKVRERARLGVRFHTLVLADGSRLPVSTNTLTRDGDPPARESAAKIGGAAIGGAILGAILGGGKGAAAGAAAGAAGGTAAVVAGDRNAATLSAGSTVTVRVLSPVTITVEK